MTTRYCGHSLKVIYTNLCIKSCNFDVVLAEICIMYRLKMHPVVPSEVDLNMLKIGYLGLVQMGAELFFFFFCA